MRPSLTWTIALGGLLLLAGAMAWATRSLVGMEQNQNRMAAEATIQERSRLALWRMESIAAALVIEESARPPGQFHTSDPSLAPPASPDGRVRLHFEMDADGRIRSPQTAAGPDKNPVPDEPALRLQELRGRLAEKADPSQWALLGRSASPGGRIDNRTWLYYANTTPPSAPAEESLFLQPPSATAPDKPEGILEVEAKNRSLANATATEGGKGGMDGNNKKDKSLTDSTTRFKAGKTPGIGVDPNLNNSGNPSGQPITGAIPAPVHAPSATPAPSAPDPSAPAAPAAYSPPQLPSGLKLSEARQEQTNSNLKEASMRQRAALDLAKVATQRYQGLPAPAAPSPEKRETAPSATPSPRPAIAAADTALTPSPPAAAVPVPAPSTAPAPAPATQPDIASLSQKALTPLPPETMRGGSPGETTLNDTIRLTDSMDVALVPPPASPAPLAAAIPPPPTSAGRMDSTDGQPAVSPIPAASAGAPASPQAQPSDSPPAAPARDSKAGSLAKNFDDEAGANLPLTAFPTANPDAPPPPSISDFRAFWIKDALLLTRRVSENGSSIIQGAWVDWPLLRRDLLASISDLFPAASLDPAPANAMGGTDLLASLPIKFSPGMLSFSPPDFWSPLKMSLATAWACVLLATAAVFLVLRGMMTLSERRATFVSAVTHELRTPLATFKLYSEMLADGLVKDPAKRQSYLETLTTEADRLGHLVENVLSYSRLERGNQKTNAQSRLSTTLRDLLQRVEPRLHQRTAQAGAVFSIDQTGLPPDLTLTTDPAAVEQILFNLVDNACKYGGPALDSSIHGRDSTGGMDGSSGGRAGRMETLAPENTEPRDAEPRDTGTRDTGEVGSLDLRGETGSGADGGSFAASVPRIDIHFKKQTGFLAISVCDHGRGLTKSEARKLFRPFHKSAREAAHSAPGVGLGLALCRRLARDLGGALVIDHAYPHGACFTLTLPLPDN